MISFKITFTKNYVHVNYIAIMDKVDSFNKRILTIVVSFVFDIGPDLSTKFFD